MALDAMEEKLNDPFRTPVSGLRSHRNALSRINHTLPENVLTESFTSLKLPFWDRVHAGLNTDPRFTSSLPCLTVCRSWRNVIINNASFWKRIKASDGQSSYRGMLEAHKGRQSLDLLS